MYKEKTFTKLSKCNNNKILKTQILYHLLMSVKYWSYTKYMMVSPSSVCYSYNDSSNKLAKITQHAGFLIGETLDAFCLSRECTVYAIEHIEVI